MEPKFYRCGNTYINLANVTFARLDGQVVNVFFAAVSEHGAMKVEVRGEAEIRKFLAELDHYRVPQQVN